MSFSVAIHELEEMEKMNSSGIIDRRTGRKSVHDPYAFQKSEKRISIQKDYPREYAEYQKTKDIQKLTDAIVQSVDGLTTSSVKSFGFCSPHISIEEATQRGLRYKEPSGDQTKDIIRSRLASSMDEFEKKYPKEYANFILGEHVYKLSKYENMSYGRNLKACYDAIFLTIRNTYDIQHPVVKEIVKEHKTKPVKEPKEKPEAKPVKEPKTKPVKEPKEKPEAKPVKEPKAKPVKEPKEKPEAKPVKEPKTISKKTKIPAAVKKLVWNTNLGEELGKAKCYCCKSTDITQTSFHCGHVIAESKGGRSIVSNLKPICQNCNSSMGVNDMNEFMKQFE